MRITPISRLLDMLSPRACAVCGRRLAISEEMLCANCAASLPRTDFDRCSEDNEMARLLWGMTHIERCAAFVFFEHGSDSARMVYDLKYHGFARYGVVMGRMMAMEYMASGFFDGIDVIIPVPLASRRLRQRGYNQSFMLSKGISQITGLPVVTDVLVRKTFAKSQTTEDRLGRMLNVENTFSLSSKAASISGKHVLVVDDVVTTGATVCACTRELESVQGVTVSVLSWGFSKS